MRYNILFGPPSGLAPSASLAPPIALTLSGEKLQAVLVALTAHDEDYPFHILMRGHQISSRAGLEALT